MKTVSLIGTYHAEIGMVAAAKLQSILESIQPEVAFMEVPTSWGYEEIESHSSLESEAVSRYRLAHSLVIVPVDTPTPPESFFRGFKRVVDYVERANSRFRQLADQNKANIAENGLFYLNSESHESFCSEMHAEILRSLEMRMDPALNNEYEAWCRQNDLRDAEMVENIEAYCGEHSFEIAVFLVGASHRSSIVRKSKDRLMSGSSVVHWDYTNDRFR